MNNTQFEILKKIEQSYQEISRLTAQLNMENDDAEQIISRRGKLLSEIDLLKKEQNNLPLGASGEEMTKIEKRIKALVLSVMTDSALLLEQSKVLHASMKEEISKLSTANKAAQSYAAYKK